VVGWVVANSVQNERRTQAQRFGVKQRKVIRATINQARKAQDDIQNI
jgi:hypothetical protein